MKKLFILLFLLAIFFSCAKEQINVIRTQGRNIELDGAPYLIKGICYHPVPRGNEQRRLNKLTKDVALMVEAGINTIRVYEPISERAVLDEIDAAGLMIVIGFGYNQGGNLDILSGTFIDYVNSYKNHNAILFWELGNEYNYHPGWFEGDIKNLHTPLNNAARLIHPNGYAYPLATAHVELLDSVVLSECPNIDIWGMNVYRLDNPESIFSDWKIICDKPMYLSDAGEGGYMTIAKNGYLQESKEEAQSNAIKIFWM